MPARFRTLALGWIVLVFACSAHAVQDCELNGESVNPANGHTTRGKTGLMRCKDRDSGQPMREQELRNGDFVGLVRYFQDGKLSKEHSVNERGNMQGRAREFAANGQVVFDANYDNGSRTGLARAFHETGEPRRAVFHEGGREKAAIEWNKQGQMQELRCADRPVLAPAADDRRLCGFAGPSQIELFSARGELQSRITFDNGQRTRYENYWRNGRPQVQQEISAARRVERRFAEDGTRRRETHWAAARTTQTSQTAPARLFKVLEQEFSERGSLVREQRWGEDGAALSDVSFYLNGQPRQKTEFSREGGTVTRRESQYDDSGKLAGDGLFVEAGRSRGGLPVGSHKRYDEAGRVAAESIYDDRGRLTREKLWDEAGRLIRDDEVFEDGSRKAYAK